MAIQRRSRNPLDALVRAVRRWLDRPTARIAIWTHGDVVACGPHEPGTGETLLVYVHEYATRGRSRHTVRQLLQGELGADSTAELERLGRIDLLAPSYGPSPLLNDSPFELASELQALIDRAWQAPLAAGGAPYRRVILMGYSAGALLLRKAMVFGLGQLDDHPDPDLGRERCWSWAWPSAENPSPIERVVLVAGVNRGWSLRERPADMRRLVYIAYRLLMVLARTGLLARFVIALERGEPFVANLRVQWLRLTRQLGQRMPLTVQLLGTIDDIVGPADNKDVLATPGARLLAVHYTNHVRMLWLDDRDPQHGPDRRRRLVRALAAPPDRFLGDRTREAHAEADAVVASRGLQPSGARHSCAVFIMHGIRDNADWCRELRQEVLRLDPQAYCVVSS